jgi:hypothetical protein
MSTHDPASVPPSSPVSETDPPKPSASNTRSFALVGILGLLLLALWYDYKVARPQVEHAYNSIEKINSEYNSLPGKKYLTEKEVQSTLNRKPAKVLDEGQYHVEIYSWRSGLPIRSHNYYAVYQAGVPLIFLKHYKFGLPMEELQGILPGAIGSEEMSPEELEKMSDSTGFQMRPQGEEGAPERPRRPFEEATLETRDKPADAAPPKELTRDALPPPDEPKASEPKASEPKADEPKTTEPAPPDASTPAKSGDK